MRDFDPEAVERLLCDLPPKTHGIGPRMGKISGRLLGAPYRIAPLGGAPDEVEALSVSVSVFDCVTFMEHVFALALSASPEEFPENVRRMRYRGGRVTWGDRNHYMTDWIGNNTLEGLVEPLVERPPFSTRTVTRTRRLDVVEGFPARDVDVRGLPKRTFHDRGPELETGDLAFFMSTRHRLDVFHCGLIVAGAIDGYRLRHAARSQGGVVEQPLKSFTRSNRMSGIIVVRPHDTTRIHA